MNSTLNRLIALAGKSPMNPYNVAEGYRVLANSSNPTQTYQQGAKEMLQQGGNDYLNYLKNPMNFILMTNPMKGVPKQVAGQSLDDWAQGIGSKPIQAEAQITRGSKPREQMSHDEIAQDNLMNMPEELMGAVPAMAVDDLIKRLRGN